MACMLKKAKQKQLNCIWKGDWKLLTCYDMVCHDERAEWNAVKSVGKNDSYK